MHSAIFYRAVAIGTPILILLLRGPPSTSWGATIIAAMYTALMLAGMWIFPIFPAQPKLGPVYTNVTHMVPMGFPVLLIVPAFFLDLVLNRLAGRGKWLISVFSGSAFLAALIAVQWPFGMFMISPAARNALFGQIYFPYQMPPSMYQLAYQFQALEPTPSAFWSGMGIALVASILSARVGIAYGDWLTRIRR